MGATLWFNIAHYALRPWPWILVGLASLIVYPTLDSIAAAFPNLDPSIIRHDLAYPAMLVFVPHRLLGLVVASLAAAYMSTISSHLNWGASYVVNDYYRRFLAGDRSEHHYVAVGRATTVALIIIGLALPAQQQLARLCRRRRRRRTRLWPEPAQPVRPTGLRPFVVSSSLDPPSLPDWGGACPQAR